MFTTIYSPYGQNPNSTVEAVTGVKSLEAFSKFVTTLLEAEYGLTVKSLPALHIGFGLAVEVETAKANYFLKFSSLEAHSHPDDLIAWWTELQVQGYPIPHLVRSKSWQWYQTPWEDSVVYLMTTVQGKPCTDFTEKTLDQYIEWMAAIHSWGEQYPHDNRGSLATWNAKWEQRHALLKALEPFDYLDQTLIQTAMQEIEAPGPQAFTQVIVHGDARLCHALYEDESFTGFIDFDQSTEGERWIDLCYGLISGPKPHSGSQLTLKQVQYAIRHYHEWLKIPADEQTALKACFAYAGLETLSELAKFHQRGVLPLEEIRKTESLLFSILKAEQML